MSTLTSHSPSQILVKALIDAEHGVEVPVIGTTMPDWACYMNYMPDSEHEANNILCIFDTAGLIDGRSQRAREIIDHPGWQVRLRSKNYSIGYAKATAIAKFFDNVLRLEVILEEITYRVQGIHRTGTPIPIGQYPNDRKRREQFSLNGTCTISQIS